MPRFSNTSLFSSINFFRRASATWAALTRSDADGIQPDACRIETLESRVLLSAVNLMHVDTVDAAHPPAHLAQKAAPAPVKIKTKSTATTPPAAPKGLSASVVSPTSVHLSWTAGDGSATGFIVLRGTDGLHFTSLANVTSGNITTFTDSTALSFHTYDYEVEEVKGNLTSAASAMTSATTPLLSPSALSATATGAHTVLLTWTINEPQAGGYYVLRSTDGVDYTQIGQLSSLKVGNYTDTSASSATHYTYEVQAYNGSKTSAVTKSAAVTTPLAAPSALTATYQNGAINLAWTNNDLSASGYLVFRSVNGGAYAQIASVSGQSTASYSDSAVVSGHSYSYKIQADTGNITSPASAIASANTPLAAPTSLTAKANSPTSVTLAWTDNDANAAGYLILRGTDGVHFTQIAKLTSASAANYTDAAAVSGTTYSYQVRAVTGTITSDPTNTASITLALAAPATFTATAVSPTSVKLSWSATDPLANGYNVLRSTDGINFTQIASVSLKTTTVFVDTVSSATGYTYKVQAINSSNASAYSKAVAVTTALIAPTGLSATLSGSSVQLGWTDNDPAATGYTVLRSTDGVHFTALTSLTDPNANSYTDSTISTGHIYTYQIIATGSGNVAASPVTSTPITYPLVAPSALAATVQSPTSVKLAWTDNDPDATGYVVLRASDGTHFTTIAKLTSGAAASYTDATAASGHTYTYAIQAVNGTVTSPASTTAAATTPLATPVSLTATAIGPTSVKLTWVNKDVLATGVNILRSTDGVNYTQIAQISGTTYTDTAASDTAYYYEVQATNSGNQSAVSQPATVKTPLIAPSSPSATIQSGSIALSWTDNDSNAAGYYVLRSTGGKAFTQVANVVDPNAAGYTDTNVLSGHAYSYEVQAYNGSSTSAMSAAAPITTPLAAPSVLTVTTDTSSSVQLSWTDNDANATGYDILRSPDGTHFTQIAALTSASAATYTDSKVATATTYTYEVEATAGAITSPASNTVNPTTPLATPTAFTATLAGAYVSLSWADNDSSATGYNILESSDGINFTQIAQVSGASTKTYIDTTVTPGNTYYYQVQSSNNNMTSAVSTTATITTPAGNVSSGVSVTTRYGGELVITATGVDDSVSVTESGGTLTITGDGQTFTDPAPAGGTFIYTRGGSDSISIDSSVNSPLTVDTIDNATTAINSSSTAVNAWIDSTDTFIGSGTVHRIASFAGGVSKALGASLANPKDAGSTFKATLSLFGAGPVAADVNQGEVGDCYFLSSLAAFANQNPQVLLNSAVDLGDGTFAVEFHSNGNPVFIRVNNSFSSGGFGGYLYAHPGSNNTIWAAVMEKAFCYFRTGANTYNSINSGWMGEVYTDLGVNSTDINPAVGDNTLFNLLSTDLSNNDAVTFGTQSAPNLVSDHAYTLLAVQNIGGTNYYIVRNPWGVAGDSLENSQGIAKLTYAQFIANFVAGTAATN